MIHLLIRTKEVAAALVRSAMSARQSADQAHRDSLERLRLAQEDTEAQARHAAANEAFIRELRIANSEMLESEIEHLRETRQQNRDLINRIMGSEGRR